MSEEQQRPPAGGDATGGTASRDAGPVGTRDTAGQGPFQYTADVVADRVTYRDDLTRAQSSGPAAARLSGDHFSRLLYGAETARHISPYGVPPTPGALDTESR
jgi:hypothetical protein